jgi:excisionase family DNA binding protein
MQTEEMIAKKPAAEVSISKQEQNDIQDIYEKIRRANAKLVGPDGETRILPSNVYSFLLSLLSDLSAGHSVTILQRNASLTTVEASKLLGVSRQFLIRLLEKNEIPFHRVGTHRRLYARDVLAYKAKRDAARTKILDDLGRAESEEGLYDRVPDDFESGQ